MKTLFISLAFTLGLFATVSTASAERTFEKTENVVKITIRQKVLTFNKPTTTLVKTCVDDARYECVYKMVGRGKKAKEIKIYEYRAHDYAVPFYKTEEKVAAQN